MMLCQKCEEEIKIGGIVFGCEAKGEIYCLKCAFVETGFFNPIEASKLDQLYQEEKRRRFDDFA